MRSMQPQTDDPHCSGSRRIPSSFDCRALLLMNRAQAVKRQEERQIEDLRERLGRLNPVKLRHLREAQARLIAGTGSDRDARLVEGLGFTNSYTRRFFRERISEDDPLLKQVI
ncbi:MAG: hypothetical protein ACR2NM_10925 [Bythopirellula sp.]